MEQLWSLMPEFWEGFKVTLLLLAVSGVAALILGTLIAAMRISPVASLRGIRRVLGRDRAEHTADPGLHLHRVRAAHAGRARAVPDPRVHRSHVLHVAVHRRSPALGHQRRADRPGRGGPQHRPRIRADRLARRAAAGVPHDGSAADQRLHRSDKEHLRGRRFFVVELFATTRQLANDNGNIVLQILFTAAALYW